MKYVIVKHAGDNTWSYYFESDPKDGVHRSFSCHFSYTGKSLGVKAEYDSVDEAKLMVDKLNHSNPSGDYAVCPLIAQ